MEHRFKDEWILRGVSGLAARDNAILRRRAAGR
jgi:hypothetical protein